MPQLKRLLKADIMKLKSTQTIWMHFYIPVIGLIIFLSYFSFSPWNSFDKVSVYFTVLSMLFPILISIITSMAAEQEYVAGEFKNILSHSGPKVLSFVSKYILLILLGLLSTILAVIGFYIGFHFIDGNIYPFTMYLYVIGILIGSNMIIYMIHFFLSFRFSKSISIGVGILESLILVLFRTGMGHNIWPFYPSAWSIRFIGSLIMKYQDSNNLLDPALHFGIIISIVVTILSFIIILIWFRKWEGKKLED